MNGESLKDGRGLSMFSSILNFNLQSTVCAYTDCKSFFLHGCQMTSTPLACDRPNLEFECLFSPMGMHIIWSLDLIFHVDITFVSLFDLTQLFIIYFLCISAQSLFSWRPDDMPSPQPSFFSFKSIIENSKMKVRIYFVWPIRVMKGNKAITWVSNQTNFHQTKKGGGA